MKTLQTQLCSGGRLDGRRARSERTQNNIIEAYLSLLRTGARIPSRTEIIQLAKCSRRTFFVHFPTIALLNDAAVAHSQIVDHAPVQTTGTLHERIEAYAATCAGDWERWLPLIPLVGQPSRRTGGIRKLLDRQQRTRTVMANLAFAPELTPLSNSTHRSVLLMIEAVTSMERWSRLREAHGMSRSAALCVLVESLERILPAVQPHLEKLPSDSRTNRPI